TLPSSYPSLACPRRLGSRGVLIGCEGFGVQPRGVRPILGVPPCSLPRPPCSLASPAVLFGASPAVPLRGGIRRARGARGPAFSALSSGLGAFARRGRPRGLGAPAPGHEPPCREASRRGVFDGSRTARLAARDGRCSRSC